jgi:hypothetical protein
VIIRHARQLLYYLLFHFITSFFMADTILPTGIINQKHFDRYAAKWLSALSSRYHEKLRRSFQATADKNSRSQRVTFSLEHIIYLISSVGASYIQARFLLMDAQQKKNGSDDAASDHNRFTIALYATNEQGERVSAYYVSNEVVTTYGGHQHDRSLPAQEVSTSQSETAASEKRPQEFQRLRFEDTNPSGDAEQIPHLMVRNWLAYWQDACEITPAMFRTSYGPLQGYTFSLSDFREPLFNAQPLIDGHYMHYNMRVDFGLHKYYPAVGESCEPTLTFGLVLQLQVLEPALQVQVARAQQPPYGDGANSLALMQEVSDPFFDMSMPCPPNR